MYSTGPGSPCTPNSASGRPGRAIGAQTEGWQGTPTDIGLVTLQRFERLPRLHRRICGPVLRSAARRIWEIGAGIGNVTEVLAQGNRLVLASDIRPDYVAHLRTRFADRPTVVPSRDRGMVPEREGAGPQQPTCL